MTLKHGSLFSGVGGFDMGADNAGMISKWQCEIGKLPRSVLKKHWPTLKQYVDVNDVKGNETEPVDVISFGSPCQDLSIAGKRKGLEGDRSGLFHQAIRIAKEMKDATNGQYPRFLIWENVRGALSSNEGKDFEKVIEEMASLGAVDVSWRLLNAANFGPPQRRVRIFVIADLRGNCAREVLSQSPRQLWNPPKSAKKGKGTTGKTKASPGSSSLDFYHEISPTITAKWHKGNAGPAGNEVQNLVTYTENKHEQTDDTNLIVDETIYFKPHLQDGARVQEDTMGTLTANMGTGGNNVPMIAEVYSKSKRAQSEEDYETWVEDKPAPTLNVMDNTSEAFATVIAITERAGKPGGGKGILLTEEMSPTLNTAIPQKIAEPTQTTYNVRRLTPKECERLMGWPDDHTKYDSEGKVMSDSARYKMCGNGISTPVAQWICENLIKAVEEEANDGTTE